MKTVSTIFVCLSIFVSCTNSNQHKNNAEEFFGEQKYESALSEINSAIELMPDSSSYYDLRQNIYSILGYYEEALLDIEKINELSNKYGIDNLHIYYERSNIKAKMGLYKEALLDMDYFIDNLDTSEDFNKYLFYQCYVSKGSIYFGLDEYENAAKCYKIVLEKNTNFMKELDINALVGLSNLANTSDEALELLNRALSIDTTISIPYAARAVLYFNLEELDLAYNDFKMALSINPFDSQSYLNLGQFFAYYTEHDDSAVFYLEKGIELAPQSIHNDISYMNLGVVKARLGHIDEAINNLKKAEAINPDNDIVLYNLSYVLSDNNYTDEALKKINWAISINPSDADYYNLKGVLHLTLESNEDAESAFLIAIKINPEHAVANFNLGFLYALEKKHEQAIYYYDKAISQNYNLEESLVNSALQKIEINQISSACEDLIRAFKMGRVDIKNLIDENCN